LEPELIYNNAIEYYISNINVAPYLDIIPLPNCTLEGWEMAYPPISLWE
jgi:hypothetical protein